MRYGILLTSGHPRTAASLAAQAEAAGWDGVFTWDGIAIGAIETWDPWVLMAGMAMTTERVTLGAIVTPPSRRRPWKLAREALTLDHLSDGRLVLPVGLGALDDAGLGGVGEATDARIRGELLDETLAILEGLWSGEPFGFAGRHYRFEPMVSGPRQSSAPGSPSGSWEPGRRHAQSRGPRAGTASSSRVSRRLTRRVALTPQTSRASWRPSTRTARPSFATDRSRSSPRA